MTSLSKKLIELGVQHGDCVIYTMEEWEDIAALAGDLEEGQDEDDDDDEERPF